MVERKLQGKWYFKCQIYNISFLWDCTMELFLFVILLHVFMVSAQPTPTPGWVVYHDQYSVSNSIGMNLRHGRPGAPTSVFSRIHFMFVYSTVCLANGYVAYQLHWRFQVPGSHFASYSVLIPSYWVTINWLWQPRWELTCQCRQSHGAS